MFACESKSENASSPSAAGNTSTLKEVKYTYTKVDEFRGQHSSTKGILNFSGERTK